MRRRGTAGTVITLTLLLAAGAVALWLAFSPEAGDQPDFSISREQSPFGLYAPGATDGMPPGAIAFLVGTLGLGTEEDYQDYSLGLIEDLGTRWIRLDFAYDGNGFRVPERYLEVLEANGIVVVGCPRAIVPIGGDDLADYESRLAALVAGHPAITVWQIDSEPGKLFADAGDYAELFLAGRRAVAGACPSCRIALAGAPVLEPSRLESLEYYDMLLGMLAAADAGDSPPFDIFDMHYYGTVSDGDELSVDFAAYTELLERHGFGEGVGLWMTECATYSGAPAYPLGLMPQGEGEQAEQLVIRFATFLGEGGERVAWRRLHEDHGFNGVVEGYFDNTGLVFNGIGGEAAAGTPAGTPKAAFDAYKLMIRELDGYAAVSRLAPGQYRFDFNDGRESVFVVWATEGVALVDELRGRVSVTTLDGAIREDLALEPEEAPVFVKKR